MSYNEQLQRIVKKYEDAGNPLPATAHDIAIWAIEQGLWDPLHRRQNESKGISRVCGVNCVAVEIDGGTWVYRIQHRIDQRC
jgi:hypothetical protein